MGGAVGKAIEAATRTAVRRAVDGPFETIYSPLDRAVRFEVYWPVSEAVSAAVATLVDGAVRAGAQP